MTTKARLARIELTLTAILAALTRLEVADTFTAGNLRDAQLAADHAPIHHGAAADAAAKTPAFETDMRFPR